MRRVALLRHTPLRQRRPHRPWTRAEEDKVTPALAEHVFRRDVMCLQARVEPDHQCRDRWGNPHRRDDRRYLRIAHVKKDARMGKRAEPRADRLVVECDDANNNWSSANRDIEKQYLLMVEGTGDETNDA